MNGLIRTTVPFLLIASAFLLGGCHPSNTEASTGKNRVFVNQQLSLLPYLAAPEDSLSLSEQFSMEWAFPIHMNATEEKPQIVNSCPKAIQTYEAGQEPVRPSEYQAYRQAVFTCYAADLVSRSDAILEALESFSITADWFATLPAELAPLASTAERKRLLNDPKVSSWTDISTVLDLREQGVGSALVDTSQLTQELTVLATGELRTGKGQDILILTVNLSQQGTYAVVQLFLLSWNDESRVFELIKEY